jgi:hypothetical protein
MGNAVCCWRHLDQVHTVRCCQAIGSSLSSGEQQSRYEKLFRLIGGRPNLSDTAAIALVWLVASSEGATETGHGAGCLLWVGLLSVDSLACLGIFEVLMMMMMMMIQ